MINQPLANDQPSTSLMIHQPSPSDQPSTNDQLSTSSVIYQPSTTDQPSAINFHQGWLHVSIGKKLWHVFLYSYKLITSKYRLYLLLKNFRLFLLCNPKCLCGLFRKFSAACYDVSKQIRR